MAILQQQEQQQAQPQEQEGQKLQPRRMPRLDIGRYINSPYLFILAPMLIGGFFLVLNPQYVADALNYPYASAFILAIPVAVFIIKLVLNFFSVIEKWIRLQFEKARNAKRGHFFEIVTAVFMFVSVCEAGPFFNDIQHDVLYGALGYITVLAFDLIAVVCIDARRKELAKGGSKAGVYLLGVLICAGVSMVANLYSALLNFQSPTAKNFPELLRHVAPYVGIMFPIMIVFLAFSRDAEIEIDDAETYKKQQQKRIDFLAARRYILEGVLREMEQINLLKKREFFLKSILFTRAKIASVVELATARVVDLVNGEIKALKEEIAQREQVIAQQAQTIASQVRTMQELTTRYDEQYKNVLDQVVQVRQVREALTISYREFRETVAQQVSDLEQQARQSQTSQDEVIVSQIQAMKDLTAGYDEQYQNALGQVVHIRQVREELSASYQQFCESVLASIPQPEKIDYAEVAAHVIPLLPQPNYKQVSQGIESRLQFQLDTFLKAQRKEIALLGRAQKVEVEMEVSSPQSGKQDGSFVENPANPTEFSAEVFEEVSEEDYQEMTGIERGSEKEPITDPAMEAMGKSLDVDSGSVINIATRRKPLTITEVAAIIGCTERQVRTLRAQGKLTKDEQDERLIKPASVRSYLANRKVKVS